MRLSECPWRISTDVEVIPRRQRRSLRRRGERDLGRVSARFAPDLLTIFPGFRPCDVCVRFPTVFATIQVNRGAPPFARPTSVNRGIVNCIYSGLILRQNMRWISKCEILRRDKVR